MLIFGVSSAGMGALLNFVESVASENMSSLPELVQNAPSREMVKNELLAQGKAFDQGLIPNQRLFEMIVAPYFKLGRKAVQLQGTTSQGCLDAFARCWGASISTVFSGDKVMDSQGIARLSLVLRPLRRAELVKALRKTKLIEVRFRVTE